MDKPSAFCQILDVMYVFHIFVFVAIKIKIISLNQIYKKKVFKKSTRPFIYSTAKETHFGTYLPGIDR